MDGTVPVMVEADDGDEGPEGRIEVRHGERRAGKAEMVCHEKGRRLKAIAGGTT